MSSLLTFVGDKRRAAIDLNIKTRMVRICNLPAAASNTQICTLFAFFGETDLVIIYPTDEYLPVSSKIAFLRYVKTESAAGAIHMTNTHYLDKTLIITPVIDEMIPDEQTLIEESKRWNSSIKLEKIPLINNSNTPTFKYSLGLPHIPPSPEYEKDLAPLKINELCRTVYVENLHKQVNAESILTLFSGAGEVKYVRVVNVPESETNYGLVEFSNASSIPLALQYNGFPLCGLIIRTDYSYITIDKRNAGKRTKRDRSNSFDVHIPFKRIPSPEWKRSNFRDDDNWKRRNSPKSPRDSSYVGRHYDKKSENSRLSPRDKRKKTKTSEKKSESKKYKKYNSDESDDSSYDSKSIESISPRNDNKKYSRNNYDEKYSSKHYSSKKENSSRHRHKTRSISS